MDEDLLAQAITENVRYIVKIDRIIAKVLAKSIAYDYFKELLEET